MIKKVALVLAMFVTVLVAFSSCVADVGAKVKSRSVQTIQGVVTDASMNILVIQAEDDTPYSFSTEDVTIDSSKFPYVVGAGVEIHFEGELDNAKRMQEVAVKKITVVHSPLAGETTTQSTTQPGIVPEETTVPPQMGVVETMVSAMTLEEKVAQMFIVRCPVENAVKIVEDYQFGGYILFGRDFKEHTKESIIEKISSYQKASKTPMLIGVDEEGGTVVRISSNKNFRAVSFWSPQALYREGGFGLIASDAKEKSMLLKSLGVNLNFAPVCDVSTNPSDFIFKRAFGNNADLTSQYVTTVVNEMNGVGMGSVLKHFPGYGNNVDTHTGVAIDSREYSEFVNSDFLPFQAGMAAGAGSVLVSHNVVNSMDPESPASLSANVHRIIREDLGFDGVIITDDLAMGAIKQYSSDASAAVTAVKAGNDLLICTNFSEQMPSVVQAVRNGEISEEQIKQSVSRVLRWKQTLGLI